LINWSIASLPFQYIIELKDPKLKFVIDNARAKSITGTGFQYTENKYINLNYLCTIGQKFLALAVAKSLEK